MQKTMVTLGVLCLFIGCAMKKRLIKISRNGMMFVSQPMLAERSKTLETGFVSLTIPHNWEFDLRLFEEWENNWDSKQKMFRKIHFFSCNFNFVGVLTIQSDQHVPLANKDEFEANLSSREILVSVQAIHSPTGILFETEREDAFSLFSFSRKYRVFTGIFRKHGYEFKLVISATPFAGDVDNKIRQIFGNFQVDSELHATSLLVQDRLFKQFDQDKSDWVLFSECFPTIFSGQNKKTGDILQIVWISENTVRDIPGTTIVEKSKNQFLKLLQDSGYVFDFYVQDGFFPNGLKYLKLDVLRLEHFGNNTIEEKNSKDWVEQKNVNLVIYFWKYKGYLYRLQWWRVANEKNMNIQSLSEGDIQKWFAKNFFR